MKTILYNNKSYPAFQAEGNASQFAIPFAKHYCKGMGVDIGFCKEDWKFPGAIGADVEDETSLYDAEFLPSTLDYIYSSHCLEHLTDWVSSIEYWTGCLKTEGIMFLYLPHPDQEYWKPWNNRKHLHVLYPKDVKGCMEKFGMKNVTFSERDLNHSYIIIGEKS
jgi:predicted SAM-dependent methyltransferase